jgi:hypothetical protein
VEGRDLTDAGSIPKLELNWRRKADEGERPFRDTNQGDLGSPKSLDITTNFGGKKYFAEARDFLSTPVQMRLDISTSHAMLDSRNNPRQLRECDD